MSPRRGFKRPFHFKNRATSHPGVKRYGEWPECNREFYKQFYFWLGRGGYQRSSQSRYGGAARVALGLLDKPYWQINEADLARVWECLAARIANAAARGVYRNGLAKFTQYLRRRCGWPEPELQNRRQRPFNWPYYLASLPSWLADDVREYLAHCQRRWKPSEQPERSHEEVSKLTTVLRSMAAYTPLNDLRDLTPNLWEEHLAARLEAGRGTVTVNGDLGRLQSFLRFLAETGRPICERMLRVKQLPITDHIPRDVPPEQLRRLLGEVECTTTLPKRPTMRSLATMDRAWILLMLHSGLRTGEVRRLKLSEIDWERRRARIEQSKGLKDRLVPLSQTTLDALREYLAERKRPPEGGEAESDLVFLHWHRGLNAQYCQMRLKWYGQHCGVKASPHQMRHSAATLLLNAGAPVLTVQMILGHKQIDTTLTYARLYDGTVAADYYGAMAQVERQIALTEDSTTPPPCPAELLALLDSLRGGTLNEAQVVTLHTLRAGILALAQGEIADGK